MAKTRWGQPMKIVDVIQKRKDFGTCLWFNSTGAVNIGTWNPFSGGFYISMWVKWFGNNGSYQHLIAKRDSYSASTMVFDMAVEPATDHLVIDTGNGFKDFGASSVLKNGLWTNITYVRNTVLSREELYIDKVLVSSSALLNQGTGTNATIHIGATNSTPAESFNGEIDEVAIGSGSPTWRDVVRLISSYKYTSDDLSDNTYTNLALYKFDESNGSTAVDSSGNSHTGTISGCTFSTNVLMH